MHSVVRTVEVVHPVTGRDRASTVLLSPGLEGGAVLGAGLELVVESRRRDVRVPEPFLHLRTASNTRREDIACLSGI